MCMRHRSIEAKLRQFSRMCLFNVSFSFSFGTSALIDCLINPLQEQMEEWKKVANQLDKDHAKEYKKARQEIKKKSSDTLKLQKKAKKGNSANSAVNVLLGENEHVLDFSLKWKVFNQTALHVMVL
eukprot:bmy_19706T0